jgi:hypothetical protein
MQDPILLARLAALEQHLEYVNPVRENSTEVRWRSDLGLAVAPDEGVWYYLADGISRKVEQQLGAIRRIRARLGQAKDAAALAEEWANYSRIYDESQEVFHECLELLGGLTFREKVEAQLSTPIFRHADALIRDYAKHTSKGKSLAVPAAREALKRTLGRMIRLRYPEWTVWSLPLMAHEYGHVLEDRPEDLLTLARAHAPEWVARFEAEEAARRPGQKPEEVVGAAERRATAHLQVYWADAFATYVSGPAYPWAFLFLRFNPAAGAAAGDLPGVVGRLLVSLEVLRRLSSMGTGLAKPYEDIIRDIEEKRRQILPAHLLDDEERAVLVALTEALTRKLREEFRFAFYPLTGWGIAQEWEEKWRTQLEHTSAPPTLAEKDVSGLGTLRDVLNAAWLCRMSVSDKADQIARAAQGLCDLILNRAPAESRNLFSSRPQSPAGRV